MRRERFDLALPVVLGFCSGFIEAITFTGLYHTFVTFITGTLMVMVIDLVTGEPGAFIKGVVVAAYFVFTVIWLILSHSVRHGHSERRWIFLAAEGAAILAFALVATLLATRIAPGALATMVVSLVAIFAMSLGAIMTWYLDRFVRPFSVILGGG